MLLFNHSYCDSKMHCFTKQQRQGGPRYQSRTLIGNWSEEADQFAEQMQTYLEQKRAGTLQTDMYVGVSCCSSPSSTPYRTATAAVPHGKLQIA